MQRINWPQISTPAHAMKTYSIHRPVETHTRPATCVEVDCQTQASGFQIPVDETTPLGQRQAHYIRNQSGRPHTETRQTGLTVFRFPPGAECFAEHRAPLDRPELYLVRGGDHRGNPTRERRVHSGPDPWLNDFGTHQDRINRTING